MNKKVRHNPLSAGKSSKPFDLFGFVFRYGLMIIIFGLFIMTMLVPLVLKMSKPNYEVHSMLKFDPVIPSLITKSENPSITGYYHDFVRTQAQRINEFTVMTEAINSLTREQKEAIFPADLSIDECVVILREIMEIIPVSRTHLVELSIQGPKKDGLAPILNAVMDAYLEKMQVELVLKDTRRLHYLHEKKDELHSHIIKKEKQLQDIAKTVLSSTFAEDYNIEQKKAVQLQKAYIQVLTTRIQAENDFNYEKKTATELQTLPLASLVEEGVMDNRAIGFTSSWTYQQLQDMRKSIDGVTTENEDRKRVESRMKAMRNYEKKLRIETRANIDSIVYGKRELELSQAIISKENIYLESLKNEADVQSALSKALETSGQNSAALLHGKSLDTELEHDRELLFRLDTRIHELEAESRAPLRVTIESRAREPQSPVGSNIKKLLLLCVAFSFGSVGFIFLIIEFFDNRIQSPKNIIHALGHPPTWPISKAPEGIPFSSVLTDAAESVTAKALRSLATRLYREHEERQAKTFLFSAIDHSSGTSEITHNTAQALAYQSAKVLVIDTNLQEAGGQSSNSLQTGLIPDGNPLELIRHDTGRGYDILASFMPESADQHASRMLNTLLTQAREQYEFICIDAGPILQCDLTEYLAINSDVAVLITQGDSTLYRDLRRAAEILLRLEIPALAPVLNWGGIKNKPWFEKYLDAIPEQFHCVMHERIIKRQGDSG
jgi:Mrp family chromosome partitioning ATPase